MGAKVSIAVSGQRRGICLAAVFFFAALLLLGGGCGKKGQGAATDSAKAADVAVLDRVLAAELGAIEVYGRAIPRLRGEALAVARGFRGQTYAHVDGINKAVRGLGGEVEAEAAELDPAPPAGARATLLSLYDAENAGLAQALDAASRLGFSAPRALAASLVGNHAQHLTVLRQQLGASPAASVPQPFENGEEPPPAPSDQR